MGRKMVPRVKDNAKKALEDRQKNFKISLITFINCRYGVKPYTINHI